MAAPKKGSRRIVVDGVEYLWRVPRRPASGSSDGTGGYTVTVQLAAGRGSVLTLSSHRMHPAIEQSWGLPVTSVLPSHVAATIRQALDAGWKPTDPASAFGSALSAPSEPPA
jgi:hypothetical protein